MENSTDILPDDAPQSLRDLHNRWMDASNKSAPMRADLQYDELVKSHPGLTLIECISGCPADEDLRFTRLGPAHKKWSPTLEEGQKFSEALHRHMFPKVFQSYDGVRSSGTPHYWEMTSVLHGAKEVITYKRLLLPLYSTSGEFDCFLADFVWD